MYIIYTYLFKTTNICLFRNICGFKYNICLFFSNISSHTFKVDICYVKI